MLPVAVQYTASLQRALPGVLLSAAMDTEKGATQVPSTSMDCW
jgi:hypothetical protein